MPHAALPALVQPQPRRRTGLIVAVVLTVMVLGGGALGVWYWSSDPGIEITLGGADPADEEDDVEDDLDALDVDDSDERPRKVRRMPGLAKLDEKGLVRLLRKVGWKRVSHDPVPPPKISGLSQFTVMAADAKGERVLLMVQHQPTLVGARIAAEMAADAGVAAALDGRTVLMISEAGEADTHELLADLIKAMK